MMKIIFIHYALFVRNHRQRVFLFAKHEQSMNKRAEFS